MGRMKDIRLFIAEEIESALIYKDLDVAFVMADELWDEAMRKKDPRAIEQLNRFVSKWERQNRGA